MHLASSPAPSRRLIRTACALASAVGISAVCAGGALAGPSTYYASPSSTDTSGSCPSSAPCRLDHAVALAAAGDTVVVLPGNYSITYPVAASTAVTIEGAPGESRPQLIGDPSLTSDTLEVSGGAVVRHLDIETTNNTGAQTAALSLEDGTAEDLILDATTADSGGEALSLKDSAAGTLVRTVLARSEASDGEAVSIKDGKTSGTAAIYNLTAIGSGSGTGALSGKMASGGATVEDSILYGQSSDIEIKSGTQPFSVSYSDFDPSNSSGYTDQGGNLASAPVFVDSSAGDYHEAADSPTIDAGTTDPALSATDLDGNPRVSGAAPDMGAYEFQGTPLPPAGTLPPPSAPVPGVSVTVSAASGKVKVKLPHGRRYVQLVRAAQLPVGSSVDASAGTVSLTSATDLTGGTKTGTFTGGKFVLVQAKSAHPATELRLIGGSFAACRRARSTVRGTPRAAYGPRYFAGRVIRFLWGRDHGGRFRTIGRTASAAVRGTVWLTEDRCDGTLIRVSVGHVLVHDAVHHRNVLIGPGHSYLARG